MGTVKEGDIRNERGLFITHIYLIYFDINGIKGEYIYIYIYNTFYYDLPLKCKILP